MCGTKTHCVSSQFLLHVVYTTQRQSLGFYLFRNCCLYHLHEMLWSHNVLTKGTDSDNTAQQSLVMQRDGNLYPLFSE
jgi:hypothetical protein